MKTPNARALAPLYLATFIILFCGVSAVNSTVESPALTFGTTLLLTLGVLSSFYFRLHEVNRKALIWVTTGITILLILLFPITVEWMRDLFVNLDPEGVSSGTMGVVLEFATLLFCFTLLSNHALLFSVIPSMALIGLMSSENLNSEMVIYFIGFVLATVFLMGYHSHLERQPAGETGEQPPRVRPFMVLSAGVVVGAFLVGSVVSAPLKLLGREVYTVANSALPSANIPLGPLNLGGTDDSMSLSGQTPNLSDAEVMRVKSRAGMYWRGATYEEYTGASWKTNLRFEEVFNSQDLPEATNDRLYSLEQGDQLKQLKAREPLMQQFEDFRFSNTLYGAGEPRRAQGPMRSLSISQCLTMRGDWSQSDLSYTVTSLVSHATPEQLRNAPPLEVDEALLYHVAPESSSSRGRGLQRNLYLPQQLEWFPAERLQKLAKTITRDALTPYDKTVAIMQFLHSPRFSYSLNPPLLPPSQDAAEYFLFETNTGYCEQFASSMAVLLRSLRIPARVAVGYAPGQFDPQTGEWRVRELDAHAWTEVYFPTYGWIPFDPTNGTPLEDQGFTLKKAWAAIMRFLNSRQLLPSLVLAALFLALLYVLKTEAYDRHLRWWAEGLMRRRGSDVGWRVERTYRRLLKRLRKEGLDISPSLTPLELQRAALARWPDRGPEFSDPLLRLTDLYMEVAFSPHPIPDDASRLSDAWLRQVNAALKRPLAQRRTPSQPESSG